VAITPLSFTGVSQFSNDFQTILNRAVSIAQLPITALQNQQANLLQEKQLSTSFESAVSALAISVTNLGNLGAGQAMSATSSDTSKVTIASTSATTPASYSITSITSVAAAALETSAIGYASATATPVSSNGTLELVVGGTSKQFTLGVGKNNLAGLRDAINALGLGATASVLTTGTGLTPNYLSVSSNTTGQAALQLIDDPNGTPAQLLTSTNQGANAVFQLNGVGVVNPSNLINNVVAGVSFNIVAKTDPLQPLQAVTLSLAVDPTQISSALQDFVTKYNAVGAQVNAQIGPAAGLLSGNSLIYQTQSVMRALVNYNGSGTIKSLADLGIELDSSGKMSFNQTTTDPTRHIAFNSLSGAQITAAFSFLGSATTGFGGLSSQLTQISDPVTGLIKVQQDQYDAADNRITAQVSTLTDRINSMQKSLSAQLQAADALIASLNSQQQMLTATLQGSSFAAFGSPATSGFSNTLGGGSSGA
jgi:flagellar hook-associated protein 2